MSALAQQTSQQSTTVTSIDANARVDYILRFSKHVVLVLDESGQEYAHISSQFLASLPEHHNAAYLSVSPKFNDIQIRCRIIEQFFPDTPFDPEQSLSISILDLAKQKSAPLSLVLEHCQHISLQILHELCQLTEAAKRIGREVNVVLAGSIEIGRVITLNQVLFNQKISMVSVRTGQLISPKSELFREPASLFSFGPYKKFFILFTILCLLGALTVWGLYQRESHSFSGLHDLPFIQSMTLNRTNKEEFVELPNHGSASEDSSLNDQHQSLLSDSLNALDSHINGSEQADSIDIASAITQTTSNESDDVSVANTRDIYQALLASYAIQEEVAPQLTDHSNEVEFIDTNVDEQTQTLFSMNTSEYYTQLDFGFVVQYATISYQDEDEVINKLEQFAQLYEDFIFKFYRRLINDQQVLVITSEFYTDKESAKSGLLNLPASLAKQSPWIKSISTIKQEIERFKSSQ